MSELTKKLLLYFFSCIFCIVSFFASLYIAYSVLSLKQKFKKYAKSLNNVENEKPLVIILTNHILFMSLCDAINGFMLTLRYFPMLVGKQIASKNSVLCKISGFIISLSGLGSVLWYGCVGWCLYLMLTLQFEKIKEQKNIQIIITWTLTIIISLIPFINNDYGGISDHNNGIHSIQCWLKHSNWFYVIKIPESFIVILSVYLLIKGLKTFGYIKCCVNNSNIYQEIYRNNNKNKPIIIRILFFSVVFLIVWIPPVITRIYQAATSNKLPLWADVIHNLFVSFYGIGNAIVWSRSPAFKKYKSKPILDINNNFEINNNENKNSISSLNIYSSESEN